MAKKQTDKDIEKKYSESENITINRSDINFAPFNPKFHSKEEIQDMVKNFKKVGYLGGIIWNFTTKNLVGGHKRVMAMDKINNYDGSEETDYLIRVEKVEFDLKTEKEQNVFLTVSQKETDDELMRRLLPDIDYKNAGLTEIDMSYYGHDLNPSASAEIADSIESMYAPEKKQIPADEAPPEDNQVKTEPTAEEKKDHVRQVKETIKENALQNMKELDSYIMVSFMTAENKRAFMVRLGLDEDAKLIVGEELSENIEILR